MRQHVVEMAPQDGYPWRGLVAAQLRRDVVHYGTQEVELVRAATAGEEGGHAPHEIGIFKISGKFRRSEYDSGVVAGRICRQSLGGNVIHHGRNRILKMLAKFG